MAPINQHSTLSDILFHIGCTIFCGFFAALNGLAALQPYGSFAITTFFAICAGCGILIAFLDHPSPGQGGSNARGSGPAPGIDDDDDDDGPVDSGNNRSTRNRARRPFNMNDEDFDPPPRYESVLCWQHAGFRDLRRSRAVRCAFVDPATGKRCSNWKSVEYWKEGWGSGENVWTGGVDGRRTISNGWFGGFEMVPLYGLNLGNLGEFATARSSSWTFWIWKDWLGVLCGSL